ncbi:MAG: RDD family protein [Acidobacteria bacterium]|nr:RDD family protein [Acidobacteriota bacterium]
MRRTRRTTTRPVRIDPPELPLVAETPEAAPVETPPRVAHPRTITAAAPGTRVGAALIDAALLLSLDLLIVALTIRVANLTFTVADISRLRPVPMVAFFALLAFLYLVAFTISGGQTVGKMIFGLRVTGDDGRPVDLTGAVVRALGAIASFLTLGALFVPVLFDADRRAVHDRLAGTRVVSG